MSKKRKISQTDDLPEKKRIKTSKSEDSELTLFSLPPEIIKEILYYLITTDCARFSFTCKPLRAIIWSSLPKIDLPYLQEKHLRGLLRGCKLMTGLESLKIKITPSPGKTSDPLNILATNKNLTLLEFDSGTFDPYALISPMTSLRSVVIHWNKRPSQDIWTLDLVKLFPNHPHLTSFALTECSLSALQGLDVLSKLKSLTIEDCINIMDEDHLTDICTTLTGLTELNLRYYETPDPSPITALTNLESLDISGSSFVENLSFLTKMTQLMSLDVTNYEVLSHSSVAAIAKLTQLTRLIIAVDEEDFHGDIGGFSVLTNLRELAAPEHFDYSRCKNLEKASFQYTRKLLQYVPLLPNLKDLSLIEVPFNSQLIQQWQHLTRLQIEQFEPRKVIPQLKYLKNLRELSLNSFYNDCQESLFKVLMPMTSLRTLGIQNLILAQTGGLDELTQLQLIQVKFAPDLEWEGTHPTVAVEYALNRRNYMGGYNNGDDSLGSDFDDDDEDDF